MHLLEYARMMRRIALIIAAIIAAWAIIWAAAYLNCLLGPSSQCIWNICHHWFPLPTCVCVN